MTILVHCVYIWYIFRFRYHVPRKIWQPCSPFRVAPRRTTPCEAVRIDCNRGQMMLHDKARHKNHVPFKYVCTPYVRPIPVPFFTQISPPSFRSKIKLVGRKTGAKAPLFLDRLSFFYKYHARIHTYILTYIHTYLNQLQTMSLYYKTWS
jgi:hypothetical protein